ncbi:MAG: hypothetical protein A3K66_07140 [Euryarchaeota archaeon RBG_16_67_27]|nr:MAG: hypothetical protein A3K66_07140 [Euryarchaeota archaeon RBG_16_67_27]
MTSFPTLDRSLAAAVSGLHDHLWIAPAKDERRLLARLLAGAVALDGHLGTRGLLAGGVRPIVRDFQKSPGGKDLFEFLHTASNLAAAAESVRTRPKAAAKRASEAVSSLAIGVAAASDSFHLVEAFEAGKTDFLEFTAALADVLEQRGVVLAGEFKRSANATWDIHAIWDERWSKEFQRVAAIAALGSAGFTAALHVEALRTLGHYHEVPYGRLVPVVSRILGRAGAHA